ncbi:glycoside hydrolase family 28 protein [Muricauda sp. CAU 1633]|uniref:glycoside hydrolase family 28 protein n=1 Tax=Allomuricauda sp. CAU 1633 TaxID=2816036 RepID=UPI001A8E5EAA|nr:glycoside hydrolase family 28 protein [Muricauda sp. CAU 1633]MBO0324059.1 glycoside hydrolase family 28 protein [Muricauda sp. CAU 1633]
MCNKRHSAIDRKFILLYFIVIGILTGCQEKKSVPSETKSKLVQDLESVFYSEYFMSIPETIYNASDYGAVGDSITLNTVAIQKTIDAAHEAGGGKVVFKPGIYLSGALFMKSNVELHLEKGVTIKAIQDDSHYPEVPSRIAGFEMDWPAALINVYEQKNVSISGEGIIDGNGKYWWDKFWGDPIGSGEMWKEYKEKNIRWALDYDCKRVRPVVVYKSSHVQLKDFTVNRAGFWTISLTYSDWVHVDGLIIRNNIGGIGPSSDGINSDSSSNILVENCDIDCNDDNLCIKAGRDADGLRVNRPAKNIVYRNCITRAGHGLFTIGSETSGGMYNIEVYGLEGIGTNTGIRFKSAQVRGGVIDNIWFHDIKMKDVKSPFQFELNWYPEYSYPVIPDEIPEDEIKDTWRMMTQKVIPPERGIPEFKNITLTNIDVKGAETAIYANAYPQKPIHNLKWENVSIEAKNGGAIAYAEDWDLENVSVNIKSKQLISIKGSNNIALPDSLLNVIDVENTSTVDEIQKMVEGLLAKQKEVTIFPVNPLTKKVLFEKDTTKFSEEMAVYIFPERTSEIEYIEPLGDGFYVTPVNIQFDDQKNSITVNGEKRHKWYFRVKMESAPKEVTGADSWSYNKQEAYLEIHKEAAKGTLTIK